MKIVIKDPEAFVKANPKLTKTIPAKTVPDIRKVKLFIELIGEIPGVEVVEDKPTLREKFSGTAVN